MAYNRKPVDSTSGPILSAGSYHVNRIDPDDFNSNSIFVPIDTQFSVTFDDRIEVATVDVNNENAKTPLSNRNKKGSIQLSSIVNGNLGSASDSLNMRALKQTSKPDFTITTSDDGVLAKDQSATIEVEMANTVTVSNANSTFSFEPVTNLASNTTYFFNVTPDVKDENDSAVSFEVGTGFVTDNSRSLFLSSQPFKGHKIALPSDSNEKFEVGEKIKKKDRVRPVATVLSHDTPSKLVYNLDEVNYSINVSFTATDPCVITSSNHGLTSDNKITVYDIVSGEGLKKQVYDIASVTVDTITLDGVDTSKGTAGRISYYVDFHAKDEIISLRPTIPQPLPEPTVIEQEPVLVVPPPPLPHQLFNPTLWTPDIKPDSPLVNPALYPHDPAPFLEPQPPLIIEQDPLPDIDNNIQLQAKSEPSLIPAELEFNTEISQFMPTTSGNYAKAIRYNDDTLTLNYVPVENELSDLISTTDNFANNIILKQGDIRMFVRANTNPEQNVHPFDTSAPTVTEFSPDANDAITRKLEVVEITRIGTKAIVLTNSVHNLRSGDIITIEEADQVAYNKTTTVQVVINSFEFTYEVTVSGNDPRSPATGDIILKVGPLPNPSEQATAFQVRFSQSMNTSTLTVANNTHLISANGTSATFSGEENSASSTIQLSTDEFATTTGLVNCVSISANTGNSLFTIVPETLLRGKAYKIKVTTNAQDLGGTNTFQDYITTDSFATGTKSINPLTGKELIFVDNKPPKIKKISLGSLVLESSNNQELSSPEDLDNLAVNLGSDNFVVQFNESMNIATVNVNSTNTDPFGTIQLSADDFVTVVQMSGQPTVTSTSEKNDTFTFSPAYDLSAESNYILKITKGVSDDAPNQNFLVNDNVSSVKMMTVTDANGTFTTGEVIKGTRTMTVTSNTKAVTTGVTAGELILGTTSLAKGRIYDLTEAGGKIATMRYTELISDDGNVREFQPGEQVTTLTSDPSLITLANSSITSAPEGTVISHDFGANKVIYREANSLNPFTAGSTSANDRVTGASSNVVAKTSVSTAITNSGISTTTTALTVTSFMRNTSDSILELSSARTGIDHDSNVIIKFSQTMNTDTIIVNSTDSQVNSSDTVILSKDSNFTNCIPLLPNPTITENGSKFEFKPVMLANTSLRLSQHDYYYVKVTRGAKTKGGSNTELVYTSSSARIGTGISPDFKGINASVFNTDGTEVILGTENNNSKTSSASVNSPIIFHYSEAVNISAFVSGVEILISTNSNYSSPITVTLAKSGRFGNQIIATPSSALSAGTRYYVKANSGGSNDGGHAISSVPDNSQAFGSFTTAS